MPKINQALVGEILARISNWFKVTQLKYGWARCYELEKAESPWATAEAILALHFLGEPMNSLTIRKGFLYYYHNFPAKEGWEKLVWNPRTIDALPWSVRALALSKSNLTRRLRREALSALTDRGKKSGRLWPTDSYYVLYTCTMTLKALHALKDKQDLSERLINNLKSWKAKDGGYGTQIKAEKSDPCYTSHILETFLDMHVIDERETNMLAKIIKTERNSDGGWRSEFSDYPEGTEDLGIVSGASTVEGTVQCLVALLKAGESPYSDFVEKAVSWLLNPRLRDEKCGYRLTENTEVRNFATYYAAYGLLHFFILKKHYDDNRKNLKVYGSNRTRRIIHGLVFENYFSKLQLQGISSGLKFFAQGEKNFLLNVLSTSSDAANRRVRILTLLDERPMSTVILTRELGMNPRTEETAVKSDIAYLMRIGLVFEEPCGFYWTILDAE